MTPTHAQTAAPLALPPAADQAPVVIAPTAEPMGLALPPPAPPPAPPVQAVEAAPLNDIKKDSIGILANSEGGLGAGLWKGTSRILVERFLPMMLLPSPYAAMNNLTERFLLTTAAAPDGTSSGNQSLTSLRVDRLVALGKADEAWKLASLASADPIDDISLRQAAEAALLGSAAADVCAKVPALLQKSSSGDWQKLLIVCQLQAKDNKAAQVSLDLLHTEEAHDENFFALAEKNIIAGNKQLPRQLTPVKAINLALVQLTDLPVRAELYAHPDAALIRTLLKLKSTDDVARLIMAEHAAAKGIISADDLAEAYRLHVFAPDALAHIDVTSEQGAMLRALLYQAAQQEKNPATRVNEAIKFLQSLDATNMGGAVLTLLGQILGDVQPAADYNAEAAAVARIYLLAGKNINAVAWLDFAKNPQNLWPLAALAGLESDKDFAKNMDAWLTAMLHVGDQADAADLRTQENNAATLLLLLDATGLPVSDDVWAKIADGMRAEKTMMPPAFVIERLRAAANGNRKGEAILMGLIATTGGKDDPPILATIETIRALRAVGLTSDAHALAKDVMVRVLGGMEKS